MVTRLLDLLALTVRLAVIGLIVVIVGSIALQVLCRYGFDNALIWPEEVARYSFIWCALLGVAVLVRDGDLIAVDMLWTDASPRIQARLEVLVRILLAPLLLVLAWQGVVVMGIVAGQLTASTQVPVSWVYLALPSGCGIALLFDLEQLVRGLAAARRSPA